MERFKVILRRMEEYDVPKLRKIFQEGMEELNVKPFGKVFVKPNVIFAHRRYGTTGYTDPIFLKALLEELSSRDEVKEIILGEHCAVTVPTRYAFREAGYGFLKKIKKVRFSYIEEEPKVKIALKKGVVHKELPIAKPLAEADFKIWAPKLKHHVSSKLTCALKLNLGILDSKTRLIGHDYRLEEKIADLYEIGHPDFVAVDAKEVGQQNELVPKPLHLGLVMMGTKGVAIDSVGARIIGFSPNEIEHLRIARERGWEPKTDEQIEIVGDVSLEELKEKTKNFDRTFSDPRELDTPIRFYFGNYPNGNRICNTGCINMIKTALAIFEAYDPGSLKRANPVAVVIGEYPGEVDGKGKTVVLVGDCSKAVGGIKGRTFRVPGCPVLVPFFIVPGSIFFGLKNPYNDFTAIKSFPFLFAYSYLKKFLSFFR